MKLVNKEDLKIPEDLSEGNPTRFNIVTKNQVIGFLELSIENIFNKKTLEIRYIEIYETHRGNKYSSQVLEILKGLNYPIFGTVAEEDEGLITHWEKLGANFINNCEFIIMP